MSVPEGVLAAAFLKPDGSMPSSWATIARCRRSSPTPGRTNRSARRRPIDHYLSLFESLLERDFPRVGLDESFRLHESLAAFLEDNIYRQDGIPFFSRRKELPDAAAAGR